MLCGSSWIPAFLTILTTSKEPCDRPLGYSPVAGKRPFIPYPVLFFCLALTPAAELLPLPHRPIRRATSSPHRPVNSHGAFNRPVLLSHATTFASSNTGFNFKLNSAQVGRQEACCPLPAQASFCLVAPKSSGFLFSVRSVTKNRTASRK